MGDGWRDAGRWNRMWSAVRAAACAQGCSCRTPTLSTPTLRRRRWARRRGRRRWRPPSAC
eukprot:2892011-Pleurochrysis_carterae.AAC.1